MCLWKNASFPSQQLNAVSPLILLALLSQHHLHPQVPFHCAHRKESVLPFQRKNHPQPKHPVPGAKEGWWSYRLCCSPVETQWCSVLRASRIKECVKSIIQLVVTIAVVLLVFGSHWPNSVSLPRTQQFQMDSVFSSTSCSQPVFSAQEIHCTSVISTQERPNCWFVVSCTGFLWDEPQYLARVRHRCWLSRSFPNPTLSSYMPSCLFPM